MEKDNIQKELFELEAPKKRPKNRFSQLFQKTDFMIGLSAEKLVFVSIGIVLLLVVFFALGVERGKTITVRTAQISTVSTQAPVQRPAAVVPAQQAPQVKTAGAAANVASKEKVMVPAAKPAPVSAQSLPDKSKPYTIVAASFSKEVFANQEVVSLRANGLEAFVIKSDPYYLACVGAFANKDGAKITLNKVRQMHKDAYVRAR
jgi:cell division septation protein DedD